MFLDIIHRPLFIWNITLRRPDPVYLRIYSSIYISIHSCLNQSINLSIYLWLYSPCGPLPFFQVLNLYTVGRIPWAGDQHIARPLPTHTATQTHNKCIQTSMLRVGFEPTIPVLERAKTVHSLDRAATVITRASKFLNKVLSAFGLMLASNAN
jgi:hypothetical protein